MTCISAKVFTRVTIFAFVAGIFSLLFLGLPSNVLLRSTNHLISSDPSSLAPPIDVLSPDTKSFDGSSGAALRALCDATDWHDGLWLISDMLCGPKHDAQCGGLNNVRNRIQTTIRLAIDAGAGVMLAPIVGRNQSNDPNPNEYEVYCMESFYDVEFSKSYFALHCPQLHMEFCRSKTELNHFVEAPIRPFMWGKHQQGTFAQLVKSTLAANDLQLESASDRIVWFADTMTAWNYEVAGELSTVCADLFRSLPWRQDLLALGEQIHKTLNASILVGIHLRAEADWPPSHGLASIQIPLYVAELEHIRKQNDNATIDVYVSCGDQAQIQLLREELEPKFIVHDKWTALAQNPRLLAEMDALGFDHKGIIEYQVLVQADHFLGIITSTFSDIVAYARTVDDVEDFFSTHIHKGIQRNGIDVKYPVSPAILGNKHTKLVVFDGPNIMDSFP